VSSFWEMLSISLAHIFKQTMVFPFYKIVPYIFWILIPYQTWLSNIVSQFVGCLSLIGFLFYFYGILFVYLSFWPVFWGLNLKKSLPKPVFHCFTLFSFSGFTLLSLMFKKSLIHFELYFCMRCEIKVQFYSAYRHLVYPILVIEDTVPFPMHILTFCWKSIDCICLVSLLGFYSVSLVAESILCQYHVVLVTITF
jgi:hypothetical protein